jgi:Ca-activated chloride channel homolog
MIAMSAMTAIPAMTPIPAMTAISVPVSLAWPWGLLAFAVLPLIVLGYLRLAKARANRVAELAAKGFVANAASIRNRKRRHIPFLFSLAAITLLLASMARPQANVRVPNRQGTVILAFDISNSMRADDLKPTRMEAAKKAAERFVTKQPKSIKIGVVAFSDGGIITQKPTSERAEILSAIKRLKPQGGTSLGQGLFSSLSAINGKPIELPEGVDPNADSDLALSSTEAVAPPDLAPTGPVSNRLGNVDIDSIKIGYFGNAAIVLLSDGENTASPNPVDIAELASVAGVKIYPVGIGKPEGAVIEVDGFQVATALDEESLKEVASKSGGTYFAAPDEASLVAVYDKIDLKWTSESKKTELTSPLATASIGLLGIGALLSLKWFGRLV